MTLNRNKPDHARMHVYDGSGKLLNDANCIYATVDEAITASEEARRSEPNAARVDVEAWLDSGGDEIVDIAAWSWNDATSEWKRD